MNTQGNTIKTIEKYIREGLRKVLRDIKNMEGN
jgi:hypothetical protein